MHDFNETVRISPYLEEFREIFKQHRLHFGVPEDVFRLAEQLNESAVLSEEISATMRSIIYRENGAIPSSRMVKMLGVAIGGPYFDERSPEIVKPYRQLEGFMVEVVRSFRQSLREAKPFSEVEVEPEKAGFRKVLDEETSGTAAGRGRQEVYAADDVSAPQEPAVVYARRDTDSGGIYSEAHRMSSQAEDSKARIVPGPGVRGQQSEPFYIVADTPREGVTAPTARKRPYWVLAVLAFLVVVGFGLVWHHGSRSESAVRTEQTVGAGGAGLATKSAGAVATSTKDSNTAFVRESSTQQAPGALSNGNTTVPLASGVIAGSSAQPQGGLPEVVEGGAAPGKPDAGSVQVIRGDQVGSASASQMIAVAPPESPRASTGRPTRPAGASAQGTGGKDGFLVSSGVMGVNLLSKPVMPPYPKMAAMWGIEGQVILQAVISRNGQVLSTNVLQGHHLLRGSAQSAVSKWVYRPRVVGGRPVDVATIVIVDFKMRH